MRSASLNADGEIAHALARCFQKSLQPLGRFQHQYGLAFTRDGFSDGTGAGAADLFVGIQEDCYRTMARVGLAQGTQSEHHHDDAGFHVQHAGTIGAPAFEAKCHAGQRTQRPNSIEVPEKHDWLLVFGAGKFDLEMIAVVSDVVNFYPPAPVLKFLCQKSAHLVDSSFVVAWRFNFDHALE